MKKRDDTIVNGKAPGPDADTALQPCLGQGDGQKRSRTDNPASFLCFLCASSLATPLDMARASVFCAFPTSSSCKGRDMFCPLSSKMLKCSEVRIKRAPIFPR